MVSLHVLIGLLAVRLVGTRICNSPCPTGPCHFYCLLQSTFWCCVTNNRHRTSHGHSQNMKIAPDSSGDTLKYIDGLTSSIQCRYAACRDGKGWIFQGSCYLLIGKSLTWARAKTSCRRMGMRLADITSEEENVFIISLLSYRKVRQKVVFGLNDKRKEGRWMWAGIGRRVKYSYWGPGEPNGSTATLLKRKNEDCGVINSKHQFKWVDVNCGKTYGYHLCEENVN